MDVYDAIFGTDLELVGSCKLPCVSSKVGRLDEYITTPGLFTSLILPLDYFLFEIH